MGTNGRYTGTLQQTTERVLTQPFPGTGAGSGPWSQSCVTSLRTQKPRGLASNGRFYYPGVGLFVGNTTGLLDEGTCIGIATAGSALLSGLNAVAETTLEGAQVSVMSQGGLSGPPITLPVTSVRVDGRLDHQERRENDLPSVYQSVDLV